MRTNDPRSARRSEQFGDQACSIVEYLAGEQAPEARKAAFRAFLRDKRASRRHEETFFHHFGFGFGSLLDAWRPWVLEQGIGPDLPPPPNVREALLTRVLPVIRDPEAPRGDRILAIRDWKKAGVTLGADTLIELLRKPEDINKDEIIWSLNAVSGMPWGDDPDRWQAWWDDNRNTSAHGATDNPRPRPAIIQCPIEPVRQVNETPMAPRRPTRHGTSDRLEKRSSFCPEPWSCHIHEGCDQSNQKSLIISRTLSSSKRTHRLQ